MTINHHIIKHCMPELRKYCDKKVATTLFEQLFELLSAAVLVCSKLFELVRVVVVFVVVRPISLPTLWISEGLTLPYLNSKRWNS